MEKLQTCVNRLRSLLEEATGARLGFGELEKLFYRGFDKNPVIRALEYERAFDPSIIIIAGGRGCGKTMILRYLKKKYEDLDWKFYYINGAELAEYGIERLDKLQASILEDLNRGVRVVTAIDDIVEIDEAKLDQLKTKIFSIVVNPNNYGRTRLVIAVQTERMVPPPGVAGVAFNMILKKLTEPELPRAELFFGPETAESIERLFARTYYKGIAVLHFRAAALVNLDAFWSRLRRIDKVNALKSVLRGITEFYIENLDDNCRSLLLSEWLNEHLESVLYGLALIALSTVPKIIYTERPERRAIIEYIGPGEELPAGLEGVPTALNGHGAATLLLSFINNPEFKRIADLLNKIYIDVMNEPEKRSLKNKIDKVSELLLNSVERVLGSYARVEKDAPARYLGIYSDPNNPRKRGPLLTYINVTRGEEGEVALFIERVRVIDKNVIESFSTRRIRFLIEDVKLPKRSEGRYLVILAPNSEAARKIRRILPLTEQRRLGDDIIVIGSEEFIENALFVYALLSKARELGMPNEVKGIDVLLHRIMIGSVLLDAKDHRGHPALAYFLLPYVSP